MATPVQTPVIDEKHVVDSPVEKAAYFPDDKICLPVAPGIEIPQVSSSMVASSSLPEVAPPKYVEAKHPPFWRRHFWWIFASGIILIVLISILLGLAFKSPPRRGTATRAPIVTNSTLHSVASSGLMLRDDTTWNMHLFAQNDTGGINLQVSLNGGQFETVQKVSLAIEPRIGSPMTATTQQDEDTGVIMVDTSCIEQFIV